MDVDLLHNASYRVFHYFKPLFWTFSKQNAGTTYLADSLRYTTTSYKLSALYRTLEPVSIASGLGTRTEYGGLLESGNTDPKTAISLMPTNNSHTMQGSNYQGSLECTTGMICMSGKKEGRQVR